MKIKRLRLKEIIKEELDNIYDTTAEYDAPKYHINDVLVTAAIEAAREILVGRLKGQVEEPQKEASHILHDLEESFMDALLPIATKITELTKKDF
tara:strand:+ start:218 stop:502 length:285 start_codon:yes stop_codon:yes gene_type:complete